jgi:hypothetical protein
LVQACSVLGRGAQAREVWASRVKAAAREGAGACWLGAPERVSRKSGRTHSTGSVAGLQCHDLQDRASAGKGAEAAGVCVRALGERWQQWHGECTCACEKRQIATRDLPLWMSRRKSECCMGRCRSAVPAKAAARIGRSVRTRSTVMLRCGSREPNSGQRTSLQLPLWMSRVEDKRLCASRAYRVVASSVESDARAAQVWPAARSYKSAEFKIFAPAGGRREANFRAQTALIVRFSPHPAPKGRIFTPWSLSPPSLWGPAPMPPPPSAYPTATATGHRTHHRRSYHHRIPSAVTLAERCDIYPAHQCST